MEWRHSGPPRPNKFRVQKSTGKVFASSFWDQDGFLLTDYLPKGQTINPEYYSSLLVQLKDISKEKNAGREVTKGFLFCTTMPQLTGHLQPRRTWASVVLSPTLFSRSGPVWLPPVRWSEKTVEVSPFFVRRGGDCCRGDLVGRKTFSIFFWVACKR